MTTIPFIRARHFTPVASRKIDLIVIHSMEAPEKPDTAENVARWFAGPTAPQASAHYCIDNNSVVQCVIDHDVAWHAPGANHDGLGFEHAGYAKQTNTDWSDTYSRSMLALSAKLVAQKCIQYRIPPIYLRAADLVANKRGITTHAQVTLAFKRGTHTDPGPDFPIARYITDVAHEMSAAGTSVAIPVKADPPTLRRGDHGFQVSRLQKLLKIKADGLFGPTTEAHVKLFQSSHHLQADGVAGPNTWSALIHANFIGSDS